MSPEAVAALEFAAGEIERELICCPDDAIEKRHDICRWGIAARQIVLGVATGERTELG